jgi:hypothetical protein
MVNLTSSATQEIIQGTRPAHIPAPSVGGVIKKMLAINPDLGADEMIGFIKSSIHKQGGPAAFGRDDFALAEIIDEKQALELARGTLRR